MRTMLTWCVGGLCTHLVGCAHRVRSEDPDFRVESFGTTLERLSPVAPSGQGDVLFWDMEVPEALVRDLAGDAGVDACLSGLGADVKACTTWTDRGLPVRMVLIAGKPQWHIEFDIPGSGTPALTPAPLLQHHEARRSGRPPPPPSR